MRASIATALVAGFLSSNAAGLSFSPPRDASPAVVGLGIQRKTVSDPIQRDARRRRKRQTISETLDNEGSLYFANVTIGTPSQNLRMHIDTGSSDLWVNSPSSKLCRSRRDPCSISGTYSANSSSSYSYVNSDFNISYLDDSGASGDYVTDNVGIAGKTLNGLQFGVGYNSTSFQSVLGIGYEADEGQVVRGVKTSYSNMPQAMVDAGLIKSNAYSLWLDDLEANTGAILFGGVDTDKYHGSLQTLPVQKGKNGFAEFIITLSGMNLVNDGKNTSLSTNLPTPAILDTGSSINALPPSLANDIFQALSVQYDSSEGAGYVDCSLGDQNITLDFIFSTVTISVAISELIVNPDNADESDGETFSSKNDLCLFGITSSGDETSTILGDTFLRSAYVVYDLVNNEVSLAQTNFNSTTTTIKEIGTGANSVPGASPVVNPIQATVSQTGGSRLTTSTSTAKSTSGTAGMQVPGIVLAVMSMITAALSLT